jgi:hypothetical protein
MYIACVIDAVAGDVKVFPPSVERKITAELEQLIQSVFPTF